MSGEFSGMVAEPPPGSQSKPLERNGAAPGPARSTVVLGDETTHT